MKSISLLTIIFFSIHTYAKETQVPLHEYHDYQQTTDGLLKTSLYILSEPKVSADYSSSIDYSVNVFLPSTKARNVSTLGNELIYDLNYETVEYGLRKIPYSLITPNSNQHIIVAGDSNVFGVGVEDKDTLPVILSKKIPHSHPYNFGIRGGGPNNTLGMMEFLKWDKLIKEKNGIFIYNYYDFLMDRVVGTRDYISWSKGITPYYSLNSDGEAIYQGAFNSRYLTKFFKLLNSADWAKNLFPVLPRPSHQHTALLGKMFLKMFNIYKVKFPEGKFYVIINYNFHPSLPGRLEELEKELKKNGVPFLVLPAKTLHDFTFLYRDFHLNARGHQFEADLILKALPN